MKLIVSYLVAYTVWLSYFPSRKRPQMDRYNR